MTAHAQAESGVIAQRSSLHRSVDFLQTVGCIALGVVFLYAAVAKLRFPYDFLVSVYEYRMIGPPWGRFVAGVFPYVELVTAVCLIAGVARAGALIASSALLLLFVVAQAYALARGLDIDCGCGLSAEGQRLTGKTLARTVGLFGLSAACCAREFRRIAPR